MGATRAGGAVCWHQVALLGTQGAVRTKRAASDVCCGRGQSQDSPLLGDAEFDAGGRALNCFCSTTCREDLTMVSRPRRPGPVQNRPAPAGVEPLGTVRRSQLISTFGIGAIVDLE